MTVMTANVQQVQGQQQVQVQAQPVSIRGSPSPSISSMGSSTAGAGVAAGVPSRIVITSSSVKRATSKGGGSNAEKVGRWSDAEHDVFLRGLNRHGKQWKVIAGMIGTRTVVQVRTHAQKYFQKVERKLQQAQGGEGGGKTVPSAAAAGDSLTAVAAPAPLSPKPTQATKTGGGIKRKSLPSSSSPPSSNKKTKKVASGSGSPRKPRISISLAKASAAGASSSNECLVQTPCPQQPPAADHQQQRFESSPPLLYSSSSSVLSTVSPHGVTEIETIVSSGDSFHAGMTMTAPTCPTGESEGYYMDCQYQQGNGCAAGAAAAAAAVAADCDFMVGVEDPLEWLMENCDEEGQAMVVTTSEGVPGMAMDVQLLPESSLADHPPPMFPDFQAQDSDSCADATGAGANDGKDPDIQLQPSTASPSNQHHGTAACGFHHQVTPETSNTVILPQNPPASVSFPDLPNLQDPKVTVQSLFMDGE